LLKMMEMSQEDSNKTMRFEISSVHTDPYDKFEICSFI